MKTRSPPTKPTLIRGIVHRACHRCEPGKVTWKPESQFYYHARGACMACLSDRAKEWYKKKGRAEYRRKRDRRE